MRGYKNNALGLSRWQCELVHDEANKAKHRIEDHILAGMSREDATAKVVKSAGGWKGFSPDVAEGVRRVVQSYTYHDLSPCVHRKHGDDFLAAIEKQRGRKVGRIERVLYKVTGRVF